jgi:L-arabonate dehydrase
MRSQRWFSKGGKAGFGFRAWMRSQGLMPDMLDGRPVIALINTHSELTPCNTGLRDLAERVRWGVLEAGGTPLEVPVMSLGETNLRPTAMLYRNLSAIEVEETIRGNPIDGVVLLAGCDKTTPALLMGAASCDLPTLLVSAGPMLNGRFRGEMLGSGTHVFKFGEEFRAGRLAQEDLDQAEGAIARSVGTCMTMGTASTMACLAEGMGIALPHNGSIPAVDARRRALAQASGRAIVDLVRRDVRMSQVVTAKSLRNAVRLHAALGGSTNAVIHLLAIAGRLELPFTLADWHDLSADIPLLANLMPSGAYLMEDFFEAGGVPAVLRELQHVLETDALTVTGASLADNIAIAHPADGKVIARWDAPVATRGGVTVLRGNLAPDGAVIKSAAATPALLQHRGPAVVFDGLDDLDRRLADPTTRIEAHSIMVLRNCGPRGFPGMPEVGNMPLPAELLKRGIRDIVRISDARMSGTAYGTVVLHIAPEAAVGGPLALVRDGDMILLDVECGRLTLEVADDELQRRRAAWRRPEPRVTGYAALHDAHVMQADKGMDLDILVGRRGADVAREAH